MKNANLEIEKLSISNVEYVENLLSQYLIDPNSIDKQWHEYFSNEKISDQGPADVKVPTATNKPLANSFLNQKIEPQDTEDTFSFIEKTQLEATDLVSSYRQVGHMMAKLDPLNLEEVVRPAELSLDYHELSLEDIKMTVQAGNTYFQLPNNQCTLKHLLDLLEQTYCGHLGVECMHITNAEERNWLLEKIEVSHGKTHFSDTEKKHLIQRLVAAENLEKHLDSKFPGTKRFGLEGGETLIPLLDSLIGSAGNLGAKEIVIGMAHRGRLNVLINIFGKMPQELFDEFEGKQIFGTTGDVKYHQGFSSNILNDGKEIHLTLAFNPSHLEIVSPVVCGSVKARQDRRQDDKFQEVVPIILHGDAAFAGQGVVMETLQMSGTRAYKIGGAVHVIINNQIGFTTSQIEDARSTHYCTEVAKMIQAPIFHVNADDPEKAVWVSKLAMEYRYKFNKDIVIDLICYRRQGHNESDNPEATQPLMYQKIKQQKTTCSIYAEALQSQSVLTAEEIQQMKDAYRAALDAGETVNSYVNESNPQLFVDWRPYLNHDWRTPAKTQVDLQQLKKLGQQISKIPHHFKAHYQVGKIYADRFKMASGGMEINWGMAELLAYATLLQEEHSIRITGQDSCRGTFSHRHSVVHDNLTGEIYSPLAHINQQSRFDIYDSLLSEEAVLGFEYGYAATKPDSLVIWEAQFGDFVNGAQVVIDQFIASGEHKWSRLSGLTMLLPHGYDGQGPEHSSARLERFLQLCADNNMQICLPTSPAQIFHLLRLQIIRPMRRPLIVMSPKWLLRHKLAVSTLDQLASGEFQPVIDDDNIDTEKIKRLVLCSGKIYYHLLERRIQKNSQEIALVRIEQLYPFPDKELQNILKNYTHLTSIMWCQEEPINQGAWYNCQHRLHPVINRYNNKLKLQAIARNASASPACGYISTHAEEQKLIIDAVFESIK